ncbi:hypothetical protein KIN20_036306 [Parelaphostrongylus tenuis]|uniref:Uncharacterized protein n=1 Tax=Parelaphostrongylus tenuis TaxID=148309 RepID=A0AAD5RCL9_PARTN|nr:hypothetical protein KIN20_013007 [Parelaphostrongylus tenuis]KAJ1373794.1 hypothetical protein KIN20_036306 [Parelaphostrongylus tenuis]
MILLNADGVPKCVCSIEFELMYDGRTCGKPSAHFVSLQMVSQSRASLGIPTKFDLLDILNVTDPPTTADLDQRGKNIRCSVIHRPTGLYQTSFAH